MSKALGRKITNKSLSAEGYKDLLVQNGLPEDYSAFLAYANVQIAGGAEENVFNNADFARKRTLQDFVVEHKDGKEWRA
jgi:hypothetical protein